MDRYGVESLSGYFQILANCETAEITKLNDYQRILSQPQDLSEAFGSGKNIALIWTNPIIKASVSEATHKLSASLCCIHENQIAGVSNNYEMLGRSANVEYFFYTAYQSITLNCTYFIKTFVSFQISCSRNRRRLFGHTVLD